MILNVDVTSNAISREFLNLLNCLDVKQHVMQPIHSRGHTLELVRSHGLSIGASSVADLAASDDYCVFFNITSFNQDETLVRTVRRRYLTSEVAANFMGILQSTPAEILPAPCNFIVDHFNSRLKSTLDSVVPLLTKTLKRKPTPPWRKKNDEFSELNDLKLWMTSNLLKLNTNKTELMVVASNALLQKVGDLLLNVDSCTISPSTEIRNLGVILDSTLSFQSHIKSITKSAFYHLKNISRLQPSLSEPVAETLNHVFITSHLDYCNGILSRLPSKTLDRLQYVQNSAARVLTRTKPWQHITPTLIRLH